MTFFQVKASTYQAYQLFSMGLMPLGRYVYEELKDILRGVSQHVTIGRAMRQKKYVDNWFMLCRADPA